MLFRSPHPKPLPEGSFSEISPEAAGAVRDVDSEGDVVTPDVPDVPEITDDLSTGGPDEGPAGAAGAQPQP